MQAQYVFLDKFTVIECDNVFSIEKGDKKMGSGKVQRIAFNVTARVVEVELDDGMEIYPIEHVFKMEVRKINA